MRRTAEGRRAAHAYATPVCVLADASSILEGALRSSRDYDGEPIALKQGALDAARDDEEWTEPMRALLSAEGLHLPEDTVARLKTEDAVYMINDSRINVAGIPEDRVGELADKLLAAVRA